jgi:uncharacterized protein YndB with AHSA1/START domain
MADSGVQQGYLLLADISGYTAFLTGTELDHANGVIEDLTSCIVEHLPSPLRLVKLEGDAVFTYAPEDTFSNAERALELVERCYVGFRDRISDVVRQTTCTCAACANVGTLDLKFVAHFGEFVVQHRPGGDDLAGGDVIVVHRLLKNHVSERLGILAYVLLTDAFVARMQTRPQLPEHREAYDGIGPVGGLVEDLAPVADTYRRDRRIRVAAEDADFEIELHLHAPRTLAWDWYTAPDRMVRFEAGVTGADARPNSDGRMGVGAELHCAHGSGRVVRRILDWKPVDYFTEDLDPKKSSFTTPPPSRTTSEFLDRADGSTTFRYRAEFTKANFMLRLMKPLVRRAYRRTFVETERRFNELVQSGEIAIVPTS